MSQDRQYQKVKTYRALKVAFYMLGLPLFFIAVFLSAVKFIGHDPFTGTSEATTALGFFVDFEKLFSSPALYGIWIAFGIWAFIAIVHIVLSKTVKSRRARMLSVAATTLVVMLGSMFIMDATLAAKIDGIAENAPQGVVVNDYKTQLSYYRTISSNGHKKNVTESLIKQIETLKAVYNVEMEGIDKSGTAGNISNKPVTYYNIISDTGVTGVDISFVRDDATGFHKLDCDASNGNTFAGDGKIDKAVEGKQVVELKPDGKGRLVINGEVYSHYFYVKRGSVKGVDAYTWYAKDMMPTSWVWDEKKGEGTAKSTQGIYGKGLYNQNGMLSDGWVFSMENVIEILEDYYAAKDAIENGDEFADAKWYQENYKKMHEEALQRRDDYYNGRLYEDGELVEVDPWITALYNQEFDMNGRFSLTRDELDELLAQVGALLGDNALFDYLLTNIDNIVGDIGVGDLINKVPILGGGLSSFLTQLSKGLSLGSLINNEATMATIIDILAKALGKTELEVNDLYICLTYKADDCFGIKRNNLYLAIVRDNGEGACGTNPETDILLDIDFNGEALDKDESDYAFDFDHLSEFLNTVLNNLIETYNISGVVDTVVNLLGTFGLFKDIDFNGQTYKGLEISGISIPLFDANKKVAIDIVGILENLLRNWYGYQSAVIKPVWEFYEVELYDMDGNLIEDNYYAMQKHYAALERATYLGKVYGGMIGSTLIGDKLGTGNYPSSFGLDSLIAVQQLKADMSYQPQYFPLFALRDILASFTGITILFYFLSFVAAQREEEYATGMRVARDKKSGSKDGAAKDEAAETQESEVEEEGVEEKVKRRKRDKKAVDGDVENETDAEQPKRRKREKKKNGAEEDISLPVEQNSDEEVR